MDHAVRYYSRSGNTKIAAEAMASALGVEAVSVDQQGAEISRPVDVLFIGGALYAYGIDKHLKTYIASLKKENVKKAVVFSTSWFSKHAIDLIKEELQGQGIQVAERSFYLRGKPSEKDQREAMRFAKENAD
ncbi:flavodoxin family protein [Mobilibacterium timonense]|uniref:flavodoxin family protein n=1 Tax=Mobilibacterium timonense TaxID=1871012 RepID=UPI0013563843|nr:flavodoxin domain-containing protein [Mobilibacterium timonense]